MNSLQNGGNNQQTFVGFTNYTMTEAFEAFRYHNIPGHQNCHRASDDLRTHKLLKTTFIMYKIVKVFLGTHPLAFPNR